MSADINGVGEEMLPGSTKLILFNLLKILKYFYSFNELEKEIGVPSHVLWRYVTLRVTPEKKTAERILSRIREKKLIEEIIAREVSPNRDQPWVIISKPGLIELVALNLAYKIKKTKIDVVLPTPDPYSIPLATMISSYLRTKLCVPASYLPTEHAIVEAYEVASGVYSAVALPRECFIKNSRILLASLSLMDPSYLKASLRIVLRSKSKLTLVYAIFGDLNMINTMLSNYYIEKPQITEARV